jgi:formylglycine-generating enzyme
LPTEAEWEYSCRAGSTAIYSFGDSEESLGDYAWYHENSGLKTYPVGQKRPNAWELYDMHGNVSEWCSDWYGDYATMAVDDPTGPVKAVARVLRDGSWSGGEDCRPGIRFGIEPEYWDLRFGFRVAQGQSSE